MFIELPLFTKTLETLLLAIQASMTKGSLWGKCTCMASSSMKVMGKFVVRGCWAGDCTTSHVSPSLSNYPNYLFWEFLVLPAMCGPPEIMATCLLTSGRARPGGYGFLGPKFSIATVT
uniref:Uncharacterized protein n=1 Tax=Cannabis sativa TaxID=3483 RepID=A0A803Q6H7_CANSA